MFNAVQSKVGGRHQKKSMICQMHRRARYLYLSTHINTQKTQEFFRKIVIFYSGGNPFSLLAYLKLVNVKNSNQVQKRLQLIMFYLPQKCVYGTINKKLVVIHFGEFSTKLIPFQNRLVYKNVFLIPMRVTFFSCLSRDYIYY